MSFSTTLNKAIVAMNSYSFNENIMVILLETHYIANCLLRVDNSTRYSEFLAYLLLSYDSLEIKIAVCTHLIAFLESQTNVSDLLVQRITELVVPLKFRYS
jgi:hypothetical protein